MQTEIVVLSTRIVYRKFGMDVIEENFRHNNRTGCYRYVIMAPSVRIVPITNSGYVVFIRQFKYPLNEEILCLPAGTVEQGETNMIAAVRELAEETGYVADELINIGPYYPMAATVKQSCAVVLALGCHLNPNHQKQELSCDDLENETGLELVREDQIEELISSNTLMDGQAMVAICKAMAYLKTQKQAEIQIKDTL